MPFTPYHEGPALVIGLIFLRFIDLPTLLISSIIVDIEPLAVIFFGLPYPLHGFFHTFLGATLLGTVTFVAMLPLRKYFTPFMDAFGIHQEIKRSNIFWGAYIGVYKHILLDAPLYIEMNPFFPQLGNPFYGVVSPYDIYSLCTISFILAVVIYVLRVAVFRKDLPEV